MGFVHIFQASWNTNYSKYLQDSFFKINADEIMQKELVHFYNRKNSEIILFNIFFSYKHIRVFHHHAYSQWEQLTSFQLQELELALLKSVEL